MDPATIGAVLAAVAGGAGGALGSQVWAGVSALVRRPVDSMVVCPDRGCERNARGMTRPAAEGSRVDWDVLSTPEHLTVGHKR